MAEQENGGAQPQQPPQVRMNILTQFIRDLSFENVLAQQGTGGEVTPDVELTVNLEAKKRQIENHYEVAVKLRASSMNKGTEQQLFLLEMEYVGVFQIENLPEDQLHPFLHIECPRMLFPFFRRIISDVTRDGGFPPLNLENIDWIQLYRNQIARRQAATQTPKSDA